MGDVSILKRSIVLCLALTKGFAKEAKKGCNIRAFSLPDEASVNQKSPLYLRRLAKPNKPDLTENYGPRANDTLSEPPMAEDLPSQSRNKLNMTDFDYDQCVQSHIDDGIFPEGDPNKLLEITIQLWTNGPYFDYNLQKDHENPMAYRGKRLRLPTGEWRIGDLNMVTNTFGELAGSVQMKESIYQFTTIYDGSISMTEYKRSMFPPEGPVGDSSEFIKEDPPFMRMLRSAIHDNFQRRLSEDTIDIMVPFTRRTLCGIVQAGNPTTCSVTDNRLRLVKNYIDLAIQEGNVAFDNSGIPGRIRLVHNYLVNDYDESTKEYSDILWNMGYQTDGVIDDVHLLRAQYKADVVVMLVDNPTSCGLTFAGFPVSKFWAFSAVNWSCAVGYYTFVHEVVHFLGAQHDRLTKNCPDLTCCDGQCYNFGWLDPRYRFRSIMSYDCPTADGCPRVQYFSQPENFYELVSSDGLSSRYIRIGSSYNNNARFIREKWAAVAAFY